jgi:DNA-binding HxlR family transcriptional regulator
MPAASTPLDPATRRLVRDMLERVADRWTLVLLEALEGGPQRFQQLRRRLAGISQKMLTQTLRRLERDGVVRRTVVAVMPARVDYALTPLGDELGEALCGVWEWALRHGEAVAAARAAFDRLPRGVAAGG